MSKEFYKVYIACMTKDPGGSLTRDYMLAKQLYRKLEQKGIHTYLAEKCNPADRTEALDSSTVFVAAGTSVPTLMSDTVRNDYEDFIAGVELARKQSWRVFNYLRGMTRSDLPHYLSTHRSYDYLETDELVKKIEKVLSAEKPKYCVSDEYENPREESFGGPEDVLPDSAESVREYADEDEHPPVRRARRAPEACSDEIRVEQKPQPEPSVEPPPAPFTPLSIPEEEEPSEPVRIKPAKINRVEFSAVAPDEVKPGKSSVIDLLMYTRSQRGIVRRTIKQAKEKSSEAARSSGSVSVRQGSRVTALLFSDDMELTDCEQTLVWNGDALDFRFRVTPPVDYAKKQIDFGCSVLFDGIQITRLYFTIAVNSRKKAAVRFVRRDCRKAFVSYSHKDRLRVAEQLRVIQQTAPKLRFWMDNQSMTAGDVWRSAIASAIKGADVFLLFWSVSARDSSEVRKEWEYALRLEQSAKRKRKNGARFISPVPLDSPSVCPPPEELGDLHFGDPSFDENIDDLEAVRFWSVNGKNISFLKK